MKIQNQSELAHVLGMVFSRYANQLQNSHNLEPYLGLLDGEDYVNVSIKFGASEIVVEKGPDIDVYNAEIRHLEGKVKDQEKEIKSLNLVLEQTLKKEEKPNVVESVVEEILEVAEPEPKKAKKKQRGKRK